MGMTTLLITTYQTPRGHTRSEPNPEVIDLLLSPRHTTAAMMRRMVLALARAGYRTLDEVSVTPDRELLAVPNIGHGAIHALRAAVCREVSLRI